MICLPWSMKISMYYVVDWAPCMTCYITEVQLLSIFAHYARQILSASSWEELFFPGSTEVWALVCLQYRAKEQLPALQVLGKQTQNLTMEMTVHVLSAHTRSRMVAPSQLLSLCFLPESRKCFPFLASEKELKMEKQTGRMASWYSATSIFN